MKSHRREVKPLLNSQHYPLQEHAMDFGYFTLSDSYYPNNRAQRVTSCWRSVTRPFLQIN
jgi:hypothetical protein